MTYFQWSASTDQKILRSLAGDRGTGILRNAVAAEDHGKNTPVSYGRTLQFPVAINIFALPLFPRGILIIAGCGAFRIPVMAEQ